MQPINIKDKFNLFTEYWTPKIIAQMNDYHIKIAKIKGEFLWHNHPETDETFFVMEGKMQILFQEESITLSAGEMCVVPKGVNHKPGASEECHILIIEPTGTLNTGDTITDMTHHELDWV